MDGGQRCVTNVWWESEVRNRDAEDYGATGFLAKLDALGTLWAKCGRSGNDGQGLP